MSITAYPDATAVSGLAQIGSRGRRAAARQAARSRQGSTSRRRLVRTSGRIGTVAGVALAVCAGTGAGSAFAFFSASGSGVGKATVGSAVTVTIANATASADLLPGGTGAAAFTLHNGNPLAATFTSVSSASVVSNNIALCPSSNVSIAQTIPYALSPGLAVAANTTSGTLTIANLVKLSSLAPTACQGVGFTVTLTLSGRQS